MAVKELCRKRGFSEASYYLWHGKFGGMEVSDAKRLKALEAENAKLKKLLAEKMEFACSRISGIVSGIWVSRAEMEICITAAPIA